jgi:hypothetical protein
MKHSSDTAGVFCFGLPRIPQTLLSHITNENCVFVLILTIIRGDRKSSAPTELIETGVWVLLNT